MVHKSFSEKGIFNVLNTELLHLPPLKISLCQRVLGLNPGLLATLATSVSIHRQIRIPFACIESSYQTQ
jgi:hypothetical protein